MSDPDAPQISRFDRIRDLSSIDADLPRLLQAAGLAVSALTDRPLPPPTSSSSSTSSPSTPSPAELPKHIISTFDSPIGAAQAHDSAPLAANKAAFRDAAAAYYTLLQSVSARLRRQVYALEEAGLIAETADRFSNAAASSSSTAAADTAAGQQGPGEESGRQAARVSAGIVGQRSREEEGREREAPVTNGGLGNLDVGWLNSRGKGWERGKEAELMEEAKGLLEELVGRTEEKARGEREGSAMEMT
ncbi:MAG: hypothetical protein M1822_007472 [Bathelium mastoideum]|nr:MAG: hypothetical protein M1822_007472 [Bathelium mastoideum]